MYNEGPSEFIPTMEGICKNLKTFVANGIDPRKIACIIIVDGMRPCMDAVKNYPGLFSHVFDE